ncbi:hypothetical protein HORIV_60000 [Vreelandella olivaria]|uniref:PAS domain-containing protein n=1 Tax=Vreelandella olivaria TaxID=390919 RepID=A0ABN5X2S2_9GAMM|nr:hypothetical protein HORIV_60000 [Halomonas olivaria]
MSEIDKRVLQTIVETANDHFFIVSGEGRVLDISPGAEAVYGVSREELLASSVQQLQTAGCLSPPSPWK